ncbi:MAG TPA: hypothetical protein VMV18_09825, partial [bacterium]|nr:hypothetical protein [bacterium]
MRTPLAFAVLGTGFLAAACAPRAERVGSPTGSPKAATRAAYSVSQLAATVGLTELALSPDGRTLAFVSDESGAHEVWLATLEGASLSRPAQATRLNERVSGLVWSPDSSTLLFASDHGGDEREDLWLLRRDTAEPVRLTDTKSSEQDVHFSPDGASIAYAVDREREFRFDLEVMELATRKTRTLTKGRNNVNDIHWSRDGKTIACLVSPDDQKGQMLLVDVATGAAREIAPPRKEGLLAPAGFLADGRIVATATNAKGFRQLALVDPASRSVTFAGAETWDVEIARVEASGAILYARNVHGESEVALAAGPVPFAPSSLAPRVLSSAGTITDLSVDAAGTRIVAIRETPSRPAEIV